MSDVKDIKRKEKGAGYIWFNAAALGFFLLMIALCIGVIFVNAVGVFWPSTIESIALKDGQVMLGAVVDEGAEEHSIKVKRSNRDVFSSDFIWVDKKDIVSREVSMNAYVIERFEYGDFVGTLEGFSQAVSEAENLGSAESGAPLPQELQVNKIFTKAFEASRERKEKVSEVEAVMSGLNIDIKKEKLHIQSMQRSDNPDQVNLEKSQEAVQFMEQEFDRLYGELSKLLQEGEQNYAIVQSYDGTKKKIPFIHIVRYYQPHGMSMVEKIGYYLKRVGELFADDPREANMEGGLFPAIFGTIVLVFLMSILSFPLGVVGGIYLKEYAKQGLLVKVVRIAVNNLAGIPSIVYGIFGLGFFVYGVGATVDQLLFSQHLPEPVFGTGGVLWASLTLGILTIPIVIVATEEALGSVPKAIRDNSIALGATQFQTLIKVVLPMASPGIITGFILSMARAAGEVAPLMITGVVKLAPSLVVDGQFPFFHLDRKFMHLGFHIYDISTQSPNIEAAMPMVYVTTLLLLGLVVGMTSFAIIIRERMKTKYHIGSI